MCGRNVRNAIFLGLMDDGIGRFSNNAVAPKGFEQTIAKVMGFIGVYIDIANWKVVGFLNKSHTCNRKVGCRCPSTFL